MPLNQALYIVLPVASAIFAGFGGTMINRTPLDYKATRACFWLAAASFWGIAIVYGSTGTEPLWIRWAAVVVLSAIPAIALSEGLRWVSRHNMTIEAEGATLSDKSKEATAMGDTISGDKNKIIKPHVQGDGNVTIIGDTVTYHAAPPARRLTGKPRDVFVSRLKSATATAVDVEWLLSYEETRQFAGDIMDAVQASGWTIKSKGAATNPPYSNPAEIYVVCRTETNEARTLLLAFRDAGFKADGLIEANFKPNELRIIIGEFKP